MPNTNKNFSSKIFSSYVNLPTEPIPYDSSLHDSRVHYMDNHNNVNDGCDESQQNRQGQATPTNASTHPVPIQIVRPQQVKTNL